MEKIDKDPSQSLFTDNPNPNESSHSKSNDFDEIPKQSFYHELVENLRVASEDFEKQNPFYRSKVLLRDFSAEWITKAILNEIAENMGENYRDVLPDRVHPRTRNEINNAWKDIVEKRCNIFLHGAPGMGKTSILALIARRLLFKGARIEAGYVNTVKHLTHDTGYSVSLPFALTYCTWGDLRQHSLSDEAHDQSARLWLQRMSSPMIPLLLLDDVNAGGANSDWTIRHATDFLDTCRRKKKQVLWTSNMTDAQWREARTRSTDWERIWSRLTDNNCVSIDVLKHL